MKIQRGIVKYKERDDIECPYGITDDGRQYYFLDSKDEKKFSNGNRIASTALVEAVDPMVKASNIGVIDDNGREVIPFHHRSIRPINDDIVLAEIAEPVSSTVIEANQLRSDPTAASKLVSIPALIKDKLYAKMGDEGRFLFNDQFSEATVYDINGNNLVNDEYFSFIGIGGGKLFFSKNTADSEITEYSILPPEVQSDVTPENDSQEIDVADVSVSEDTVEQALASENVMNDIPFPFGDEIPPVEEEAVSEEVGIPPVEEEVVSEEVAVPPVEEEVVSEEVVVPPVEEESVALDSVASSTSIIDDIFGQDVDNPLESIENENDLDASMPDFDEMESAFNDVVIPSVEDVLIDAEPVYKVVPKEEIVESPLENSSTILEEPNQEEVSIENPLNELLEETEETPENSIDEVDKVEEVDVEDKIEDTTLDDMFHEVTQSSNLEDEEEEEDIFKDSVVQSDSIDINSDYEYRVETPYKTDSGTDSIMNDAARSLSNLVKQNKEQKASIASYQQQINSYEAKIEKISNSRKNAIEKIKSYEKDIDELNNRLKHYETLTSKLENKNKSLENRVHEVESANDSLRHELEIVSAGKQNLVNILSDAKALLGEEERNNYSYSSYEDDHYYGFRRSA